MDKVTFSRAYDICQETEALKKQCQILTDRMHALNCMIKPLNIGFNYPPDGEKSRLFAMEIDISILKRLTNDEMSALITRRQELEAEFAKL